MTVPDRRVAVITGAGRGIGRAAALILAERGYDLALAARSVEQLEGVAEEATPFGVRVIVVPTDVTSDDDCRELMSRTVADLGRIDLLLCNAGGGVADAPLLETSPEHWRQVIDLNVHSVYSSCRHAVPHMREVGGGKILVVGSGTGHVPVPGVAAYAVAKAGAAHIVRVLAQELVADSIDVNEIVPGPVLTELTKQTFDIDKPPPISRVERVKGPEEVGDLIGWLADTPHRGPTGQVFSLARRQI